MGKIGGNRKPQTFRNCEKCGNRFGPLERLAARFCSHACAYASRGPLKDTKHKSITKARSAQSLLAYHVKAGNLIRPNRCEECSKECKAEGAHFNYDEPLRVRWLCRSCHARWDKAEPKGGTAIIARWEAFTGQKAVLAS